MQSPIRSSSATVECNHVVQRYKPALHGSPFSNSRSFCVLAMITAECNDQCARAAAPACSIAVHTGELCATTVGEKAGQENCN